MPRVLMLARHFPPIGGAGVHRTLGSVRHLPALGYEPVVVSGTPEHGDRWNPRDATLLMRVPPDTEIHRVAGGEPPARTGARARAERVVQATPGWVQWWVEQSFEVGMKVGRGVDLVVASCIPYETAFAGARLAAALGVPWVADLEDPWALDEMRLHPSAVHRARDLRSMRRALATASAVVMAAPEAAERVRRDIPSLAGRIVTGIEIGYEPEDLMPPESRHDDAFRIVHTGSMHTELGRDLRASRLRRRLLGGTVPGLDILTRSHVYLLEAIERLIAEAPRLGSRVELHLAGELTAGDRRAADGRPFVRTPGLLSHPDTVALMRSADLLFLPMHDLPAGTRAGLIPYKTYEYLAARRPVLAAVPDGDVRDMLEPFPHVSVIRPSDVDAMCRVLRQGLTSPTPAEVPDTMALRDLERRRSVERIAAVYDQVLARSAKAPTQRAAAI